MQDHTSLRKDFNFTNMVQTFANGLIGGLVVLWNADLINVTKMRISDQEIHCMVQGLQLAYSHNLVPLEVEVDSQDIIMLLHSNNVSFDNLTTDCRYFLNRLGKPVVLHAYREQNRVADKLAKAGCNFDIQSVVCIFEDNPDFAWSVFAQERSAVQRHVLDQFRPHSDNYNIVNTYCNSGKFSSSSNIILYNTLAPATGASACDRIQYKHPPSVRNI
uniref:Uncharacterized protein LOC104247509 n=1 Tax=Nicotiana sylvestris TaxID=4096 RepID=A0A1U7YRK0_NICSY|nr:PREDICTED: uncharacterized protein LOC104247509 [Nicotiana sylvestris]